MESENNKDKQTNKPSKKKIKKEKELAKSLSTFHRNQNKLMVASIAIADRKAMILIRINTALISGLIVFQKYIQTEVLWGNYVMIILCIGMLISLIYAILAVKPFAKKFIEIYKKDVLTDYPNLEENNFFLLEKVPLKEYESSMEKVFKSQDLQLGNMTRINYVLNMLVNKKFLLLDKAYKIFLLTLTLVVLIFLASKVYTLFIF